MTETATVNVTVNPVNDAPTQVVPGAQTLAEDTPKAIAGVSVADVDGTPVTTTLSVAHGNLAVTAAPGVTLTGNGTGTVTLVGTPAQINAALAGLTYTNTGDYNGPDTLTVSTNDGVAPVVTNTVGLTVTPVADIANDAATTNEDTLVNINVNANDSFENAGHLVTAINGTAIAVGGSVAVVNGTVTLKADGTLDFTPAANYNGPASFTYTVSSGGVTETATVNVTVNPVNDAPVAGNDTANAVEDTALTISAATLLANDTDADGNTLSITAVQGATHGTVALVGGNVVFTPAANYSGPASFTYTVSDGQGGTATGTVNLTVAAVADKPTLTITNAAGQLVFANSWESAPVTNADTSSTSYTASTTLEGWTRVDTPDGQAGGTNAFEIWSSRDSQANQAYDSNSVAANMNTVVASAGNGNNFLELNNASNLTQTIGITRTVATQAGMVYELSFDTAGRPGYSTAFTNIGVYVDGVLYKTITNTSPQTYIDWKNEKINFTGDGASHVITIRSDATSYNTSGRGAFIDNIELTATQGVVAGNAGSYTNVHLANYVSGALADTDGSESLTFTFSGLPTGATIVVGTTTYTPTAGSITITQAQLATADLHLATSTVGHLAIGVTDTATEASNGSTASSTGILNLDIHAALPGTTDLLGDGLTNYIGDAPVGGVPTVSNDTLTATTTAASMLVGKGGNDTLTGNTGADYLDGGIGTDVLKGGAGKDVLYGGAGNDTLTGGTTTVPDTTTDTFAWKLADHGTAGAAAADTIADFSAASAAAGGDVLDLKDLLVGEFGKASDIGNLDHYLSFQTVGSNTVIHVSSTGQFNGTNTAAVEDQTITLTNVDLRTAFALPGATDAQLIQELLNRGKLITDGQG